MLFRKANEYVVSRPFAAGAALAALASLLLLSCLTPGGGASLSKEYYNLGNGFFDLGKYERAAMYFRKALELDPELNQARFNLALTLIEQKQPELAIRELEKLLPRDPRNVSLLVVLAYAYHLRSSDAEAIETYRKVLAISASNTDARYNMALLLWKTGQGGEALEQLRRVLEESPDDLEARLDEGKLLLELGRAEEAAGSLERYLEAKPDDVTAYLLLGESYRRQERFDKALEAYQDALAYDGKLARAWFYSAEILLTKIEDPERGLTALQQALELGFRDQEALRGLLQAPNLLDADRVREMVEAKGVLTPSEGSPEPP